MHTAQATTNGSSERAPINRTQVNKGWREYRNSKSFIPIVTWEWGMNRLVSQHLGEPRATIGNVICANDGHNSNNRWTVSGARITLSPMMNECIASMQHESKRIWLVFLFCSGDRRCQLYAIENEMRDFWFHRAINWMLLPTSEPCAIKWNLQLN